MSKKPCNKIGVIDADSIIWRVAHSTRSNYTVKEALERLDDVLLDIVGDLSSECSTFECYLTGSNNFRYNVAKTKPYKGNRARDTEKPPHFQALWDYSVKEWGFVVSNGNEADDIVGIRATELGVDNCVIVHIDKDINMIPGRHFNFVKRIWYNVSECEAIRGFYIQLLSGDAVDNIPGLAKVGPKKALKILGDSCDEQELYNKCLEAYDGNLEYLKEQADLIWIQQKEQIEWQIPKNNNNLNKK